MPSHLFYAAAHNILKFFVLVLLQALAMEVQLYRCALTDKEPIPGSTVRICNKYCNGVHSCSEVKYGSKALNDENK
jgi:hypothetical protein